MLRVRVQGKAKRAFIGQNNFRIGDHLVATPLRKMKQATVMLVYYGRLNRGNVPSSLAVVSGGIMSKNSNRIWAVQVWCETLFLWQKY